ncbi:conserved hypothetical protein [Altererythrobacter sp. B11]|uniref:LysM peptidoglycan-binding domain-containing protein n=1 Tax=Altererythrobacter sp. B11 TaxID=2060312 RepID=UPI000DC7305B|nr:LysM domain-containing protein [Altererythrobacter sp. B11]BBC73645.1 conserved hypothetical protein [Altererythrobacter sp. B11]
MSRFPRSLSMVGAAALALGLAACSSGPGMKAGAPPAAQTAPTEIETIAALLDRGEVKAAQKRLKQALRSDPLNPSLLVLRQGMLGDAKADLGPASHPYTVQPGDTMAGIAERFLGNRLKSYQLARYNKMSDPSALAAGQVLQIPGQPAQAETAPRAAPPKKRSSAAAAAAPAPKAQSRPAAPAASKADPAAAQRARTAGLAALNRGQPGEAVALLQRAATLDPDNAAISRDLARARRIAATVKSQR